MEQSASPPVANSLESELKPLDVKIPAESPNFLRVFLKDRIMNDCIQRLFQNQQIFDNNSEVEPQEKALSSLAADSALSRITVCGGQGKQYLKGWSQRVQEAWGEWVATFDFSDGAWVTLTFQSDMGWSVSSEQTERYVKRYLKSINAHYFGERNRKDHDVIRPTRSYDPELKQWAKVDRVFRPGDLVPNWRKPKNGFAVNAFISYEKTRGAFGTKERNHVHLILGAVLGSLGTEGDDGLKFRELRDLWREIGPSAGHMKASALRCPKSAALYSAKYASKGDSVVELLLNPSQAKSRKSGVQVLPAQFDFKYDTQDGWMGVQQP